MSLTLAEDRRAEDAAASDYTRAILNILADSAEEKARLGDTQRAVLNILEDSGTERERLRDTQRAVLNILEDVEFEKKKVEQINVDLTHAKADTELASRELESFSYSVAHDLRAPLRSMDGFSAALLKDYGGLLDAEGRRYLDRIRQATQRMGHLIDDLLTLASVARAALVRERVDLSALASAVNDRLSDLEPGRRIEFVVAAGLAASADPRLLDILLTNLLGNAWKFTAHQPQTRIEIGAERRALETVFYVRDNGAGFAMEDADKLFKPFSRLHSTAQFKGTGIGLATVSRIVARHRGRIWAEAAVGKGATFFFTLGGDL